MGDGQGEPKSILQVMLQGLYLVEYNMTLIENGEVKVKKKPVQWSTNAV